MFMVFHTTLKIQLMNYCNDLHLLLFIIHIFNNVNL